MKTSSLIAVLLAGAAMTAAPAFAKTSLTKGKQLCEAAAKAATPAPKSVRTDGDATKVSDATLTYKLWVKADDDSLTSVTCSVDRSTSATTLGG